jgi:hypothetical protein
MNVTLQTKLFQLLMKQPPRLIFTFQFKIILRLFKVRLHVQNVAPKTQMQPTLANFPWRYNTKNVTMYLLEPRLVKQGLLAFAFLTHHTSPM